MKSIFDERAVNSDRIVFDTPGGNAKALMQRSQPLQPATLIGFSDNRGSAVSVLCELKKLVRKFLP